MILPAKRRCREGYACILIPSIYAYLKPKGRRRLNFSANHFLCTILPLRLAASETQQLCTRPLDDSCHFVVLGQLADAFFCPIKAQDVRSRTLYTKQFPDAPPSNLRNPLFPIENPMKSYTFLLNVLAAVFGSPGRLG